MLFMHSFSTGCALAVFWKVNMVTKCYGLFVMINHFIVNIKQIMDAMDANLKCSVIYVNQVSNLVLDTNTTYSVQKHWSLNYKH